MRISRVRFALIIVRGNANLHNHDYVKTVQLFQQAVTCMPSSPYASFYLGESMVLAGLVTEAHVMWKGSLEKDSTHTLQEKAFHHLWERTNGVALLLSHTALATTLVVTRHLPFQSPKLTFIRTFYSSKRHPHFYLTELSFLLI